MALQAALTPLVISMTQGSADAFIQGSVLTGLTGRQAYNVRTLEYEITNANFALVDASKVEISITRRSKTAAPNLSDSDVIWKWTFFDEVLTSGAIVFPGSGAIILPADFELPIVEETIYAQLDSVATGLSLAAVVRLGVAIDTMSDIDRLNLITRSLT